MERRRVNVQISLLSSVPSAFPITILPYREPQHCGAPKFGVRDRNRNDFFVNLKRHTDASLPDYVDELRRSR
jgi:hypothetical protein